MKKLLKRFALVFLALFLGGLASLYIPFPRGRLSPAPVVSLLITDRNGILLREVLSDDGGRCRWVGLREVSAYLVKATLAAEDKDFYFHSGVYFPSVLRAFWQNIRRGRVVSGASTISQQLVRNIYRGRRDLFSKLFETWMAVRLEHSISKEEILEQYLNRISYGNQALGAEAAGRLYFDKPASQLSLAESSFLAVIPRSPSGLNPYRNFGEVRRRQADVLDRMRKLKFITGPERDRAAEENLNLLPAAEKFRAPHFCEYVLSGIPLKERREWDAVRTSLDVRLQKKVEILLKEHLNDLLDKGITNGAVLVLDNENGEILSMAGSRDFFDEAHDGQVNGALSLRQPGSALKPFTYALALEKGMTAATILEDSEAQISTLEGYFLPRNFDRRYHGPVSLRNALACSYNIPAVRVLETLGPDLLYQRLKSLSFDSLEKGPGFYGVGLTLGNGEVSLLELCRAYACLARGGLYQEERSILGFLATNRMNNRASLSITPKRVFSPEVSFIITSILSDPDARISAFGYNSPLALPFAVAAKTGTSKDFRDNWTVGYSPRYTVGVWVGNFDGEPMHNVSGISGCGPLFRDIMFLLHNGDAGRDFPRPEDVVTAAVCPLSGLKPSPECPGRIEEVFIRGTEPKDSCGLSHNAVRPIVYSPLRPEKSQDGLVISSPQDGDVFKLDPVLRGDFQAIRLKVRLPQAWDVREVEWWINGKRTGVCRYPFTYPWTLKPGSYIIKAVARTGREIMESPAVKISILT
jgi:penicillin-binding protein 1C